MIGLRCPIHARLFAFLIAWRCYAHQIRNLGYNAKAHTVLDGEVLQPPLLLLSGLGEVSVIGEVILNPFHGAALKIWRCDNRHAFGA